MQYESPELIIIYLQMQDVIATSPQEGGDDDWFDPDVDIGGWL